MAHDPSSPELLAPVNGAVDPELLELPRPPRLERVISVALMILTAVLAAVMAIGLVGDVRYALASAEPDDVGDLAHFEPGAGASNRFVRATGLLGSAGAIRYDRPMERDAFRLAPVVGNAKVWVEMRVPDVSPQSADAQVSGRSGVDGPHSVPPTTFVGRLLPLQGAAFRYRGLTRSVLEVTGSMVPNDAWVLVDGATPTASRWTVALAALLALFAAYNMVTIARIVRPVRR